MSARRVQQDVRDQIHQLGELFENMKENHLDSAIQIPRSNLSLAVGLIPHIVVFVFATAVIWLAKPSSTHFLFHNIADSAQNNRVWFARLHPALYAYTTTAGLFSWHPTLMTLAYAVLMSEAVLLFSPWSSPIMQVGGRSLKVHWHWILQGCAVVCSFTGIVIITANKMINGYKHYSSYHSILGIFLSGFVFIQTSGGILVQYPDILPFKIRLVTLKKLHAMCGLLTYFGGLTTLSLGLFSSWFVANADPYLWRVCIACPSLLGIAALVQLVRNHVWRC